jgi:hypothetical protein
MWRTHPSRDRIRLIGFHPRAFTVRFLELPPSRFLGFPSSVLLTLKSCDGRISHPFLLIFRKLRAGSGSIYLMVELFHLLDVVRWSGTEDRYEAQRG